MFGTTIRLENEPGQVLSQDRRLLLTVAIVNAHLALLLTGQRPIANDQSGGAGPRQNWLTDRVGLHLASSALQLFQKLAPVL